MTTPERITQFTRKMIEEPGYLFMLITWQQSIMMTAIAASDVRFTPDGAIDPRDRENFLNTLHALMRSTLSHTWNRFKEAFPDAVTECDDHTFEAVRLLRDQIAHSHIRSGNSRGVALYLPNREDRIPAFAENHPVVEHEDDAVLDYDPSTHTGSDTTCNADTSRHPFSILTPLSHSNPSLGEGRNLPLLL